MQRAANIQSTHHKQIRYTISFIAFLAIISHINPCSGIVAKRETTHLSKGHLLKTSIFHSKESLEEGGSVSSRVVSLTNFSPRFRFSCSKREKNHRKKDANSLIFVHKCYFGFCFLVFCFRILVILVRVCRFWYPPKFVMISLSNDLSYVRNPKQ